MSVSLLVAFGMLAGKVTAYVLTGSVGILADAAESVVHLVATGFATFSLWYAAAPPDADHLYGHGKVAYFASGVEGGLILLAAAGILFSAARDLIAGVALEALGTGLFIVAGLGLVNLVLGRYLIRTGRREGSVVLVANGEDVMADVWTSFGVLAGVSLVWLTGWTWLDAAVALLVALHLIWTGYRLVQRSVGGLMEQARPADTQTLLDTLNRAREEGVIANFHQLRHRRVEHTIWVEYHLLFPGHLRITEAHDRSHAVEETLARAFSDDHVHVTAHLEPSAHAEAHPHGHAEPEDPLQHFG